MRDLKVEELGHVYGAGGNGNPSCGEGNGGSSKHHGSSKKASSKHGGSSKHKDA